MRDHEFVVMIMENKLDRDTLVHMIKWLQVSQEQRTGYEAARQLVELLKICSHLTQIELPAKVNKD